MVPDDSNSDINIYQWSSNDMAKKTAKPNFDCVVVNSDDNAYFSFNGYGVSRRQFEAYVEKVKTKFSDIETDDSDIEYFEAKNPQKEIAMLREMGAYVIASHHDFEQTPDPEVIRMLLEQIRESGADVVKLAVMPQNMWDVLHLLEETNRFHENHPDHPLITMSMGAKGGISRVAGEFFGSCVTFGAGGQASAPGQLPVKQLEEILHILHQSVD